MRNIGCEQNMNSSTYIGYLWDKHVIYNVNSHTLLKCKKTLHYYLRNEN